MDKFLNKKQKIDDPSVLNTASASTSSTKLKTIIHQYYEGYLFGFICSEGNPQHPTCVICDETLGNEAMISSKLKRDLKSRLVPTCLKS